VKGGDDREKDQSPCRHSLGARAGARHNMAPAMLLIESNRSIAIHSKIRWIPSSRCQNRSPLRRTCIIRDSSPTGSAWARKFLKSRRSFRDRHPRRSLGKLSGHSPWSRPATCQPHWLNRGSERSKLAW